MVMRVAYLASQYPATSHTFIRREVEALRRRGIEVQTFSIRPPGANERGVGPEEQAFATTRYVLPFDWSRALRSHVRGVTRRPARYLATLRDALKHRVPGARSLLWSLFYFGEAVVLADDLEVAEVEHLHNHFANPGANVGYLASRYLGLGWSLTLHGISEFDYPAGVLLPEKIAAARFVACVSHFGRAQAFRVIDPQHWPKLFINRCGVDLASFPSAAKAEGTRLRVVSVGRLSPEKGQLGLLEAFAAVLADGVDAELFLIGDGPLMAELQRRIDALGIGERCRLLGRKSEAEVAIELAAADVFALASFMEGLPVVLMEALAMRLGVIAPCVAGIPELIAHEQTGLLFAPGRWDELGAGLKRLLTDRELRERLAENGRQRVEEEFAIDRAVDPLVAKLQNMLGARAVG